MSMVDNRLRVTGVTLYVDDIYLHYSPQVMRLKITPYKIFFIIDDTEFKITAHSHTA